MLSVITIDDSRQWNDIVKSFKYYDVYYLSEYTNAFRIHGDGEPILFYYEGKHIRAINVAMKRDVENDKNFSGEIPKGSYYDLVTPYGYGGFLIEGDKSDNKIKLINDEYSTYCKNNRIVSEFVRFHPILENHRRLDNIYDISALGKTVSVNLKSTEHIWNGFTSQNRNKIRKAKKLGVEVYLGRNPELFHKFIELYNATMDKDNAKDYYYFEEDFYKSVLDDLKYNSLIFYAVFVEKIVAMSIFIFANQQLHYHLSASDSEYRNVAPTNLLLYEAACWGCENGYYALHLGGGLGSKEDSLYKFKKAFNKDSDNDFFIGRRIFNKDRYDELVEIRSERDDFGKITSFFPKYRG